MCWKFVAFRLDKFRVKTLLKQSLSKLQLQSGAADGRRRLWIASMDTAAIATRRNRNGTKRRIGTENRHRAAREEPAIILARALREWSVR